MADLTLKQLSALIGISATTISLVLNNKPGISEETKSFVLEKVKEYGYKPLRTSSKRKNKLRVCLIFSKAEESQIEENQFILTLIDSIEKRSFSREADFFIRYTNQKITAAELTASDADGIIMMGELSNPQEIAALQMPLLIMDNSCLRYDINSIAINNEAGIRKAVEYLIECGHRKIGYLQNSYAPMTNFAERFAAYKKVLDENRLEPSDIICMNYLANGQSPGIRDWLNTSPVSATAFVSDTDYLAVAAIRAFKEKGIRVPEDVSVVGFDDNAFCQFFEPALTTVHVPNVDLGIMAVDQILYQIDNPRLYKTHIYVDNKLVIRNSVKKLK